MHLLFTIFVNDNSLSEFHCTFKLNINISQFCLLKNRRNQYPEMLHFYRKMHQNAFGSQAQPGPAGELTALPRPPSWIKGEGRKEKREGVESGRKERGRTPMSEVCWRPWPQCCFTPPLKGTPANIHINLVLPESGVIGLHLRRWLTVWVYLHSHFRGGLRKTRVFWNWVRKSQWPFKVIQLISPFRDIAGFLLRRLRRATPPCSTRILGVLPLD